MPHQGNDMTTRNTTVRNAPRRGGAGRMIGNLLLNVAAVGGVICLVLVFLAFFFHVSLIMFKTGSMSPTIPAGSVALVHQIPASEVEVGDVLTVDRAGKLPVTHRVVDIDSGAGDGERIIRMKGDANENEDTEAYTITGGGLVLGHVPELAKVIVWFSNPWVLGGLTLAAGSFVTWAFWPRRNHTEEEPGQDQRHASSESGQQPRGLGEKN